MNNEPMLPQTNKSSAGSQVSDSEKIIASRKQLELLLEEARLVAGDGGDDAERFYKQALSLAEEYLHFEDKIAVLSELNDHYKNKGKHLHSLSTLKDLSSLIHKVFSKDDIRAIEISMHVGKSLVINRKLDEAIMHLRDTVLRFQFAQEERVDLLLECLCELASAYRYTGKIQQAGTAIKQAHDLIAENEAPKELQARVLEELAAVAYKNKQYSNAEAALARVLDLKVQAYGHTHPFVSETLLSLGLCLLDAKKYDQAENILSKAITIQRSTGCIDPKLMSDSLLRLSGVYRVQGRFLEADLFEQGASELIGRAVEMKLGCFKTFETGINAERHNHIDMALECYRKALTELELVFDKQSPIRVPVLCRLALIAESRGSAVRARGFYIEIEDSLRRLLHPNYTDNANGMLKIARFFSLLGYDEFSATSYELAAKLAISADTNLLFEIVPEYAGILDRNGRKSEAENLLAQLRMLS